MKKILVSLLVGVSMLGFAGCSVMEPKSDLEKLQKRLEREITDEEVLMITQEYVKDSTSGLSPETVMSNLLVEIDYYIDTDKTRELFNEYKDSFINEYKDSFIQPQGGN